MGSWIPKICGPENKHRMSGSDVTLKLLTKSWRNTVCSFHWNGTKTLGHSHQVTSEKEQIEKESVDGVKASAPRDDLFAPWRHPLHSYHSLPCCISATTLGIECRNALIGTVKSCRREETSCQTPIIPLWKSSPRRRLEVHRVGKIIKTLQQTLIPWIQLFLGKLLIPYFQHPQAHANKNNKLWAVVFLHVALESS